MNQAKNKVRLNNYIAQKITETNKIVMEMEISNKYVSSNLIKGKILANTRKTREMANLFYKY
jgi:hypothetical protein